MANELAKLFITLGLDDRDLQKNLKQIQKKMGAWGKNMAIAGGAVVGGVMAIGGVAIAAADEYDKAMNIIRAGTGATGEKLDALGEDFKAVFGSIPASAEEIANAMADLNTLTGATGEELQNLTKNVLEASRVLKEDGASNAHAFGQAMQQWNIPVKDGAVLLDKLFKVTQDTGIGYGELLSQLNTYGPVMQNANFSTEEAAELFGKLTASGIEVSRVMPGLNKAFRDWAAEGKDGRKELEKVIDAMATAEDSSKALAIATGIFGAEGAQRMTTAIRNGSFSLDDLGVSLEDVEGLIQSTGEESKNLAEKMAELKNQVTEALQPLGDALMPILEKILAIIVPIIEKIGQWISDNPELMKTILLVAGAVGGLMLALGTLFMMIGPLVGGLRILAGAFITLNAAIGPLNWIFMALAVAIPAFFLAWQNNWLNIRGVTETVVEAIVHAVGWLWDKILAYFQRIAEGVAWVMKGIANVVGIFAPEWAESVRNAADSMIDAFVGFRTRTVNALKGFDADFQKVTRSFDWMVTAVEEGAESMEGNASNIKGSLEGIGAAAGDMAEEASDAFETMTGAMEKSLSALEIMQNSLYSIFGVGSPLPAGVGGEPFSSGNWFPTGTGWINPEQHPHLFSPTGLPWSEYDEGGVIPGAPGSPLPVIAHGGETVFTPGQLGDLVTVLNKLADGSIRGNAPVHLQLQLGERTIFDDFLDYAGEKYSQESHFRGRG